MFTQQLKRSSLLVAGACLVAATQTQAAFYSDFAAFEPVMGPATLVKDTVSAGISSGEFAFTFTSIVSNSETTTTLDFSGSSITTLFTPYKVGVSGVGGTFTGVSSIVLTLWDGSGVTKTVTVPTDGGSIPSQTGGFFAYTTDSPASLWIKTMTFTGIEGATVSDMTFGVDAFEPVPEPSTYVAGIGALGMLGMALRRNRK